jgi:hypothetical protein
MRKNYDVVALIFGLMFGCVALGSLWLTFVGPLNWQVIRIVAPMGLVAVGVVGLVLSRNHQ